MAAATPSLAWIIHWRHPNTVWAAFIEGNNDYNPYPVCVDRLLKIAIVTSKQCVDSLLTIVIATLTLCGNATEDSNWTPVLEFSNWN